MLIRFRLVLCSTVVVFVLSQESPNGGQESSCSTHVVVRQQTFNSSNWTVVDCRNSTVLDDFCIPEQAYDSERLILNLTECRTNAKMSIPTVLFKPSNQFKSLYVYAPSSQSLDISLVENGTFDNLQTLEELTLEGFEEVRRIGEGIFHDLQNLRKLTLIRFGARFLSYRQLGDAFQGLSGPGTRFTHLLMDGTQGADNPDKTLNLTEFFRGTGSSLTHSVVVNNDLYNITGDIENVAPHLKHAEITINRLTLSLLRVGLNAVVFLTEIEDFKCSFIGELPDPSLPDDGLHFQTVLKKDIVKYYPKFSHKAAHCFNGEGISLSPSLKRLILRRMKFFSQDLCFDAQLEYVDFFQSPIKSNPIRLFKSLPQVWYLNLQETNLSPDSNEVFWDLTKLQVLLLGGNKRLWESIKEDVEGRLFTRQNVTLKTLDLAESEILVIPYQMFASLTQLNFLNLSNNRIENLSINLNSSSQLSVLNLSNNSLRTLSDSMTGQLESIVVRRNDQRKLMVDLSENPLTCFCNNTKFIAWVQTTNLVSFENNASYRCHHANGSHAELNHVNVTELDLDCKAMTMVKSGTCPCKGLDLVQLRKIALSLSEVYCEYDKGPISYTELLLGKEDYWWCRSEAIPLHKNPRFMAPMALAALLLAGLAAGLVVMYKKRYTPAEIGRMMQCMDMRPYITYFVRALTRQANNRDVREYGVLVYFQDDDAVWARQVLVPRVNHLKVISPHDFLLGASMLDAILEAINKSKAIVVVLSSSFKDDQWCREACLRAYTSRPSDVIPVVKAGTDLDAFRADTLFSNLIATNNPIDMSQADVDETVWHNLLERIENTF